MEKEKCYQERGVMKMKAHKVKVALYTAGFLIIAGTVGHADTHPYDSIVTMIETAAIGFGCIGLGALIGQEKTKKVDAVVEVLVPRGGEYCENPYQRR